MANHISSPSGFVYAANGNLLKQPLMTSQYGYDAENRLVSAPGVRYGYDGQNKRNYSATVDVHGVVTSESFYFYGVGGQLVGTYGPGCTYTSSLLYFGRRRIQVEDRQSSTNTFYPYGEPRGSGGGYYATYTQDSATGLDYADQRYYASNLGRFATPDPYRASAGSEYSGSWNRYAYVQGDPVNFRDPSGLCAADTDTSVNVCDSPDSDISYNQTRPTGPISVTSFSRARSNLYKAQGILGGRTSFSQQCEDGLAAVGRQVTGQGLSGAASNVNFMNSQGNNSLISSAYGNAQLGASSQRALDSKYAPYLSANGLEHLTIGGLFAADTTINAWTPVAGGIMYFDPSRLSTTFASQNQGLLMHELLHEVQVKARYVVGLTASVGQEHGLRHCS